MISNMWVSFLLAGFFFGCDVSVQKGGDLRRVNVETYLEDGKVYYRTTWDTGQVVEQLGGKWMPIELIKQD